MQRVQYNHEWCARLTVKKCTSWEERVILPCKGGDGNCPPPHAAAKCIISVSIDPEQKGAQICELVSTSIIGEKKYKSMRQSRQSQIHDGRSGLVIEIFYDSVSKVAKLETTFSSDERSPLYYGVTYKYDSTSRIVSLTNCVSGV